MRNVKTPKETRYFDSVKWLNSIRIKKLRCPLPRKSRNVTAVATEMDRELKRGFRQESHTRFNGRLCNGQVITASDGYRILLTNPDPWGTYEDGPILKTGSDKITINDPEFYNAIKRVSVAGPDITFSYDPDTWKLTLSAGDHDDHLVSAMETIQLVSKHNPPAGQFIVDSKLLLPCLGSWPVTIHYDRDNPNKPLLWQFSDYSVLLMPMKFEQAVSVAA